MMIPARGRLVLRRVVGKRPPQHSDKRRQVRSGVQTRASSAAWSFGFEIGPKSGRIATSEVANGKSYEPEPVKGSGLRYWGLASHTPIRARREDGRMRLRTVTGPILSDAVPGGPHSPLQDPVRHPANPKGSFGPNGNTLYSSSMDGTVRA